METTISERFRSQNWQQSFEIEDLLQECEILEADPIVSQSIEPVERSVRDQVDGEHWKLFLDQACNRGPDPEGRVVDRSQWLYEDCALSDAQTRAGYWSLDREKVPALDVRFNV